MPSCSKGHTPILYRLLRFLYAPKVIHQYYTTHQIHLCSKILHQCYTGSSDALMLPRSYTNIIQAPQINYAPKIILKYFHKMFILNRSWCSPFLYNLHALNIWNKLMFLFQFSLDSDLDKLDIEDLGKNICHVCVVYQ